MSERNQMPWWQRAVIYQIYPRSFLDSNGDGVGDLPGITARLNYLANDLGVDAVWLSPFYPSPMADFGYDVADHCDVDPLFGTLADFDVLLAATHARGLKVILDYVPNHTSDQHPWFQSARRGRQAPYRDWYTWVAPRPDGGPPNNWLSVFGGSAWQWDATSGQYYLHSFLPQQPDLNWRNPAVQEAMLGVLRFWLDRGVDGFRMDALHYIMKDPLLRDNPPNPQGGGFHKALGAYDALLHVHDKRHPDVHAVLWTMRRLLDAYGADGQPRVAIGEMHIYEPAELVRFYGEALDELHLPFYFGLLGAPWQAAAVRAAVDRYEAALPPGAWPSYVLGNHDEVRVASRVGPAGARLAMLLLLTLRGTPTLYYGDELGLQDVPIPPAQVQDPWERRVPSLGLGRDPQRTPLPWDDSPHAGFCPATATPWLPVGADNARANVAAQRADPTSPLTLTRTLLRRRRSSAALSSGRYRPLDGVPADCFVYLREAPGERYAVALNFGPRPRTVALPLLQGSAIAVSTHLDRQERVGRAGLALRAAEGCLLRLPE